LQYLSITALQDTTLLAKSDAMSLFRPPIVRSATAALDRSLFSKTFPIAAARVLSPKNIPRIQVQLNKSHEVLNLERRKPVEIDPDPALASKGGKCLLLNPDVKPYDSNTWSKVLREASENDEIKVIPYDLVLDYNYWQYRTYVQNLLFQGRCSDRSSGYNDFIITGRCTGRNPHWIYNGWACRYVTTPRPS